MQRIHGEYKNDTARIGTFSFTATISELKNKGKETINFIVKRDVIEYIEKLAVGGTPLGRFCLVLEEL